MTNIMCCQCSRLTTLYLFCYFSNMIHLRWHVFFRWVLPVNIFKWFVMPRILRIWYWVWQPFYLILTLATIWLAIFSNLKSILSFLAMGFQNILVIVAGLQFTFLPNLCFVYWLVIRRPTPLFFL